jgi:hypothetical protein
MIIAFAVCLLPHVSERGIEQSRPPKIPGHRKLRWRHHPGNRDYT